MAAGKEDGEDAFRALLQGAVENMWKDEDLSGVLGSRERMEAELLRDMCVFRRRNQLEFLRRVRDATLTAEDGLPYLDVLASVAKMEEEQEKERDLDGVADDCPPVAENEVSFVFYGNAGQVHGDADGNGSDDDEDAEEVVEGEASTQARGRTSRPPHVPLSVDEIANVLSLGNVALARFLHDQSGTAEERLARLTAGPAECKEAQPGTDPYSVARATEELRSHAREVRAAAVAGSAYVKLDGAARDLEPVLEAIKKFPAWADVLVAYASALLEKELGLCEPLAVEATTAFRAAPTGSASSTSTRPRFARSAARPALLSVFVAGCGPESENAKSAAVRAAGALRCFYGERGVPVSFVLWHVGEDRSIDLGEALGRRRREKAGDRKWAETATAALAGASGLVERCPPGGCSRKKCSHANKPWPHIRRATQAHSPKMNGRPVFVLVWWSSRELFRGALERCRRCLAAANAGPRTRVHTAFALQGDGSTSAV